jgi:hypothetical protein
MMSSMPRTETTQVSVRGRAVHVPSARVGNRTFVVEGRSLRIASVHDASFVEVVAADPRELIRDFASSGLKADLLTFSQQIYEYEPRYDYPHDWDNAAVADSANYDEWWNRLPQEARKNVRRSAKRGVRVEVAAFDQALVQGIKKLYDESPIRQGRRFWHYGKDIDTVKADNSSYLDRSEFIGAYHEGELIGFVKLVYVGKVAVIMQILAMSHHQDKRPMNAMIAKAMEVCHRRGISYLVYSKFRFGNKKHDDMSEFKKRNGFIEMTYPKYFVPLTLKGRIAFALKLHQGLLGLLPSSVIQTLSSVRAKVLSSLEARGRSDERSDPPSAASAKTGQTM